MGAVDTTAENTANVLVKTNLKDVVVSQDASLVIVGALTIGAAFLTKYKLFIADCWAYSLSLDH